MRLFTCITLTMVSAAALAQVTPDMKAKITEIGAVVDPPSTIALYSPLHTPQSVAGIKIVRDLPYAAEPRTLLDIFAPEKLKRPLPVLMFIPGGMGNKIEPGPGGQAFYDNVMLWAVNNGMVGVNMQRRGLATSPRDLVDGLSWVRQHIAEHGGDPQRIFLWGHSAGAVTVSNYLGHPELYGPDGIGVKAAVLMAGIYDLYPLETTSPPMIMRMGMNAKPLPPPPAPPNDPQVRAQRSILTGMKNLKIPVLLCAAELDPPVMLESMQMLASEMTNAGNKPTMLTFKDHGHMSEIFAVNTKDTSVTKPILKWLRKVK